MDRGGMSGIRAFLERLGQGEPLPQALKEGAGVSVEDVEARLLAAGGPELTVGGLARRAPGGLTPHVRARS